jgi:peptide/nickel transport system ATP-binding protein
MSTTQSSVDQSPSADGGPAAPVLEIRDLHVTYRRGGRVTPAVRGVGLTLGTGRAQAVVGESGSGKTTIARTVLGLLPGTAEVSGQVLMDGEDLLKAGPRRARSLRGSLIGYIPQDPGSSLDPIRRVLEQVTEPLRIIGVTDKEERRERALRALEQAGLEDPEQYARRWPHELSGGQRQRVLIAAAVVTEPRLLVADEPTSALDVTVQKRILDRLQQITADSGTAILLITHDLAVAAARTDEVQVMSGGRIAEVGPSRQVLQHPVSAEARALVDAIPGRGVSRRRDAVRAPRPSEEPARRPVAGATAAEGPAPTGGHEPAVLLSARGLHKTFGRGSDTVTALAGVDLDLAPGESIGVVGESGSGKTTLARTILGLEQADSGDVLLDGELVRSRDRAFHRVVQPVFQTPHTSFDPMRTIGWSILEPVRSLLGRQAPRARRAELVPSLLADVGLDPALATRKPHELSGGQLQRAAIARALAAQPRVLLCDEAVSALDVTVQAQILRLIGRLREERDLALVFITHDLAVVEETCDRVVVMRQGEVVESGETSQIFADPQQEYTRDLLEAIPDPWETLVG